MPYLGGDVDVFGCVARLAVPSPGTLQQAPLALPVQQRLAQKHP